MICSAVDIHQLKVNQMIIDQKEQISKHVSHKERKEDLMRMHNESITSDNPIQFAIIQKMIVNDPYFMQSLEKTDPELLNYYQGKVVVEKKKDDEKNDYGLTYQHKMTEKELFLKRYHKIKFL